MNENKKIELRYLASLQDRIDGGIITIRRRKKELIKRIDDHYRKLEEEFKKKMMATE